MNDPSPAWSHVDPEGRPRMVDVSGKRPTVRTAVARGRVWLPAVIADQIEDDELNTKKGPVFHTAILAGIMGAKETSRLIPLCHPLPLEHCSVTIATDDLPDLVIECTCRTTHKTGVEMEALTGVSVAALTIYDMCKAFSHELVIGDIRLVEKTGGKHDV